MPRFALTIDPNASPAELRDLAGTWRTLLDRSKRPTETAETVLPGLAAVNLLTGFFNNRSQPAISGDGTVYLWLDGEIWDRRGARDAAGMPASLEVSDPELCLELYLKQGDRLCERLNGQFIIAVYDTVRGRLLLCNDRYAFRPLFWGVNGDRFACGTEIKSVLAACGARAEIDAGGAMELFAYGYQMSDLTLFQGVRALLPGSRLIYERGQVRQERHWRFRYPAIISRKSEADLVDELAERLKTACARQAEGPGRVGMGLSAGLDSRIVAAALPPRDGRAAYTTGYEDSLDALGARLLADAYGMRHMHLVPGDHYLSTVGPMGVWRTEGCFAYTHATSPQFHDRIRPAMDIIVTGHAGGALSGQTLLPLSPLQRRRLNLDDYLFGRSLYMQREAVHDLFAERIRGEQWEAMRRRFSRTVEELDDQRGRIGDAVIAWNMERRQARFTHHSGQVDRDDFEIRAPLLDNELVDFFLSVPYQYRFAQRLYKRTLAERFPEAARIPWSKTGRPVPGHPLSILGEFYLGGLTRQAVKRIPALARRHRDRTRTCRVMADEMRRDRIFRTQILDPFVEGSNFPEELLSRETARRLVREHWDGTHNHWHALATLATLSLVYRQFVENGLRAPEEAAPARILEAA
jgi:asparagine synthetase B (glutamine-hydrolysing)